MQNKNLKCKICKSSNNIDVDSYKHTVLICKDCNGVTNIKKSGKYFLEKFFLHKLLFFLPRRAYQRLFHASKNFAPSKFYDTYVIETSEESQIRLSEFNQLLDQLDFAGFKIKDSKILDISGGPGLVAKKLNSLGAKTILTEFSIESVEAIKKKYDVDSVVFDYTKDRLTEIFSEKFDLILLRSSIIFCDHLDTLISDISKLSHKNTKLLIETITPSMGEILWWQQMEFKFPVIYSEKIILNILNKYDFYVLFGYREEGNYLKNKIRANKGILYLAWSVLVDFPMVLIYNLKNSFKNIPIDQRLNHKMLFLFLTRDKNVHQKKLIYNFSNPISTHFNFINVQLKKKLLQFKNIIVNLTI